MVQAASISAPQARVLATTLARAANITVPQGQVLAAARIPAAKITAVQAQVLVPSHEPADFEVTQARVLAVAKGRVQEANVRAWTFTLDGHDYYVLRLGTDATLVYDTFAEQWYVWGSDEGDLWRAFTGCNWQGGNSWAASYGSNAIVGDDGNGALYFLDPANAYDDDALQGSAYPRTFLREITGQIATRSRDAIPCYGVQLIGSIGEAVELALTTVTLYTSDDQGHTYDEHDTITVDNGEYDARVEWWSLGSFVAPGRLFKVQDTGALHRIDYLEMIEPPKKGP